MSAPLQSPEPLLVLFAGVGGQGTLTAARLLGTAVHRRKEPVVVSQLHGMSQRGGSVQAATLVGAEEVLPPGGRRVDVLVGFELLETVRMADRLDERSVVVCNRWIIPPPLATVARLEVPSEEALEEELRRRAGRVYLIDAMALAERAGAPANINVLMLGALSRLAQCPVGPAELLEAIKEGTSPKQWTLNQRLFAVGREALPGVD